MTHLCDFDLEWPLINLMRTCMSNLPKDSFHWKKNKFSNLFFKNFEIVDITFFQGKESVFKNFDLKNRYKNVKIEA